MARACRLKNDRIRVRLPIKKIFLEIILFEISRMFHGDDKKGPQPYLEKMYLSLLLLGYYGMMRTGELMKGEHTLRAKDIHIGFNKEKLLLILFTSKTHGRESQPQEIKITANSPSKQQNERFFCPFQTTRDYAQMRGNFTDDNEQFFVFNDKTPVRPENARKILRTAIARLGLNADLYNYHSL